MLGRRRSRRAGIESGGPAFSVHRGVVCGADLSSVGEYIGAALRLVPIFGDGSRGLRRAPAYPVATDAAPEGKGKAGAAAGAVVSAGRGSLGPVCAERGHQLSCLLYTSRCV